ncbi:hypothetical protein BST81_25530 [Leptolyngbya sp. 'hensonii']|uniref:phycobiliprotein lyase n=1 Tax=Leptolyngbya sp. 'hensonii' TaxID=1922337 RepID=UPI00094FB750|nr:phycobiliprotein lyase [Leptolyngbya sp. 'hensonii']OLP15572.1 hypothetical protein BST81_25530 [Leptolyngbya sp. 'hensonii']
MDIVEFFQQSAGKWASIRTNHHLSTEQAGQQSDIKGQSEIQIELLEKTDPAVVQLCQIHQIDPQQSLCGVRFTWNGQMNQAQASGSTLLVPIEDAERSNQGTLLRSQAQSEKTPSIGCYMMGNSDDLILIAQNDTLYVEERLWFANPNVRLRHSTMKWQGSFSSTSFCSEIRLGGQPTGQAAATRAQVSQ